MTLPGRCASTGRAARGGKGKDRRGYLRHLRFRPSRPVRLHMAA